MEHHITFIVQYIVQLHLEIFIFESLLIYTLELNAMCYSNTEFD